MMKTLGEKLRARFVPLFALFLAVVAIIISLVVQHNLHRELGPPAQPRLAAPAGHVLAGHVLLGKFVPTTPPAMLPDLAYASENGESIYLKRFQTRLQLINYWATWCAPCVAELPALQRLANRLAPQGVNVVAVSLDRGGWETIRPFLQQHGLDKFTVLADAAGLSLGQLGLRGLPTTLILNQRGEEIGRIAGDYDWDSASSDQFLLSLGGITPPQ
ncbi:MAG: TlpA disulfide reductase family protein [Candidatus Symbiobacter sp.]|nr:TlpA disulfide reductase family protein [Candidatus Symbiobacter sp.]